MPPLSIMIKPVSDHCNLRCTYCLSHSNFEFLDGDSDGVMGLDLLEQIVKKSLAFADQGCLFTFQGGEPTLAGLDFFEHFMRFVKIYNNRDLKIQLAIQTNGLLITEEWAKFFVTHRLNVSLSLDGTKDLHDLYRVDAKGQSSFRQVLKTVGIFDQYGVNYNIVTVVHSEVARRAHKVYNYFRKNKFRYLQFVPCMESIKEKPGQLPYSLKVNRYASFLKRLFDQWYQDLQTGEQVSIRYFDNMIAMAMGYQPMVCGMSGQCQCKFVIEPDGSVYPCDLYVTDEWRIGKIQDESFADLRNGQLCEKFIMESKFIDPECQECKWFKLCRGGCRRDREPLVDGKPGRSRYCAAYREFFEHAEERIKLLSRELFFR